MSLFKERAHALQEKYGRVDVPWKTINRLVRGELQLGIGGGPDTLHAVYGDWNGEYLHAKAGDCYILMVSWDSGGAVHSKSIHQYGSATMDPANPHYADQALLFARQEMKPVWLDREELMRHVRARYAPGQHVWTGHPAAAAAP